MGKPARACLKEAPSAKVRADGQKLDMRRLGRTSEREITKSISIKDQRRKSSGCALTGHELTLGDLWCVRGGQRAKPD